MNYTDDILVTVKNVLSKMSFSMSFRRMVLGKMSLGCVVSIKTSFENGPLNYSPRRQCPIKKNVLSSRMNAELGENETSYLFDHNG